MKGLNLKVFSGYDLFEVNPDTEKPSETLRGSEVRVKNWPLWVEHIHEQREGNARSFGNRKRKIKKCTTFLEMYHWLPLRALRDFSFDELCKLHFSTIYALHTSVSELFEKKPQFELVAKIKGSIWRWDPDSGTEMWNDVVSAYNNIRNLALPDCLDGFDMRLDYTTGYNPFGRSKYNYNRLYLDGTFGILLYHKKQHVMTIAFSVIGGRRLLIQQIQSSRRSGNRSLFKIPSNRVEFVIEFFRRNFPGYKLYLVDGGSSVDRILANYQEGLDSETRFLEDVERNRPESISDSIRRCDGFRECIAHLEEDRLRIISFYEDTGRFHTNGECVSQYGVDHHLVKI